MNGTAATTYQSTPTKSQQQSYSSLDQMKKECSQLLCRMWNCYRGFVMRNQGTLELSEDAIARLLFWIPHSSTTEENDGGIYTGEVWREMIYGLLSLQRLAMELALGSDHPQQTTNSYATTVQTLHPPKIAATSARILLSVMQSIMPTLLAVAQSTAPRSGPRATVQNMQQRKAKFRLVVEQIKFALRLFLLVNYWKQQKQEQKITNSADSSTMGILVDGGMYRVHRPTETLGLSWDQAQALKKRQAYMGSRTGMRLGGGASIRGGNEDGKTKCIMVADLMNTARPLLWAWFESRYPLDRVGTSASSTQRRRFFDVSTWPDSSRKLLKGWFVCLGMDLLSIRLLLTVSARGVNKPYSLHYNNPATEEEIRNRKMRLFLYALRSPIWSEATAPLLEDFSRRVLQRIPLVGSLTETFLLDWILYYQHPFISEEQ